MQNFKFNLKCLKIGSKARTLNIEGVTFDLTPTNKYLAIVGDSGIGKTTLFKSLFPAYLRIWKSEGILEIECEHEINGKIITYQTILLHKQDSEIGFATQVPYFFNERTVDENLFFPLKWKNISWSSDKKKEYLEKFDLVTLSCGQMSELSGGERQLLNIARMLILNPSIAIIDECFSNMDERLSKKTVEIIKREYPDTYFLFTSHRRVDIEFFGADTLRLTKQYYKSGKPYITLQEYFI